MRNSSLFSDIRMTMLHLYRGLKSIASRPAKTEPIIYVLLIRSARLFSPLRYSHSHTVMGYKLTVAFISCLLSRCSPAAVVRAVPKVIISAVYRVCGARSFAHVGKEINKGATPPVTNYYASTAVVYVVRVACSVASCFNIAPGIILRGVTHTVNCHYIFSISNIDHKDKYVATSYGAGVQPLSLATRGSLA